EKVDLDIEGEHLIPVVWNRRLYLFWAIFTEKQEQHTKEQRQNNEDSAKYWEIKFAWSEYKNNKWSPKKISKEPLRFDKDPLSVDPKDKNYVPQKPQDFSFNTQIGERLSIQCYGTTVPMGVASTKPVPPKTKKVSVFSRFENLTELTLWYGIAIIHAAGTTSFSSEEVKSIKIKRVIHGAVPLIDKQYDVPTFAPNSVLDDLPIREDGLVDWKDPISQPS